MLAVTQSSQWAWAAFATEVGASTVFTTIKLLDAVETDVEAAMHNGGGVVGREGVDVGGGARAVRAGLVPRQERGGDGGGGGGGAALALSRPCLPSAPCGSRGRWLARRRG